MTENSAPDQGSLILPPSIARLRSPVGVNRRGMKILTFGESGGGKSFFLASMPSPIYALDSGEGGIQAHLDPKQDECFEVTNPDDYIKLVEYGLSHEDHFKSFIIDPSTLLWQDWMDYWSEKFGGEIRGSQWNAVKGPWKVLARRLNRSKMNVGQSAWLKDVLYEKVEKAPGVEGSLNIRPVETPDVERKTIYHVDIALQMVVARDSKNRPTGKHKIILTKGRRPKAVSPEDFHVGKTWVFDSKKPTSPWDVVISPILEKWNESSVDYLGVDEKAYEKAGGEADKAVQEYTVGQIIMLMGKQTNFQEYKDRVWPNEIDPIINELENEYQERIMEEHEKTKKRLMK